MQHQYTQFACPNPACSLYAQFNQGNIAHFSWIGKNKNIERLHCKNCRKAFSSRKGTLMEKAKISEEQTTYLLKCMRWGVSEEGTADISGVDIKTVRFFRSKVAKRAEEHHNNEVHTINTPSAECDELYAKHRNGKTWLGAAIAVQSMLILAVTFGSRNQALADTLLAHIWARCTFVGMVLTDGWRSYWSAVVRCFGRLFRPKREGKAGRLKSKKLSLKRAPYYGQVVKKVNQTFSLIGIECRALIGKLSECTEFLKLYRIGLVIHTIHIERWFGSLRCNVAALRRRSRCLTSTAKTLEERVWIFVSLYNWVIQHKTLSKKRLITPAMAAGLIDRPLSYLDYIRMVVLPKHNIREQVKKKLEDMNREEMKEAARNTKSKLERQELWRAPPVPHGPPLSEEKAA
jgi:transposase-like protein